MKYAEDMQPQNNPDAGFEAGLTRALERRPEPAIPVDFAARVRTVLPPQPRPRHTAQIGRAVSIAAAGVLAVAMFLLAPHAAPSFGSMAFDFELLAIVQLAGIGYWLSGGNLKRLR